jgi:uncharacterized protein (TIGR02466 family)
MARMTGRRKAHRIASAMADSRSVSSLFVTKLYRAELARVAALNTALAKTCLAIAAEDRAGQRWSKQHGYKGYTSYASLDDLPQRASVFEELVTRLDGHVKAFTRALDYDLGRKALALDSIWINVMAKGGIHAAHIHPHSVVSGTYYVQIPKNAAAIRFEDPRLPMMMAAPAKKERAAPENRGFVDIAPKPGTVLLWESFLRHDVQPNNAPGHRISISFNYSAA